MKYTINNSSMKTSLFLSALFAFMIAVGCSDDVRIVWTEGETDPDTGRAVHTITVVNAPEGTDWNLWLSSNHIYIPEEGGPISLHHGCWYKLTPSEREGKDLVVPYYDRPLQRHCWAPEGFVLEQNGKARKLEVEYVYLPSEKIADFPYNQVDVEVWDMIPSLKKVEPAEGVTIVEAMPQVQFVDSDKAGWYRIILDGECKVEAADEDGAYYAKVTLDNLKRNAGGNQLPNLVIEDWPDFGYRGFMLDISRNFTTKDNILKFIDLLAHYKASVFHLHFGDDEGWRLEIEKFPELTSFGAYHAFPSKDENGEYVETEGLIPSYNGGADPKDMTSSANGHLSKEDYVEILKYAWERRIQVIPEFDTPGHSRASIKAMEAYFKLEDSEKSVGHAILDLGAEDFTAKAPHPVFDPALRLKRLRQELDDSEVAVVLLDFITGPGVAYDPITSFAKECAKHPEVIFISNICGSLEDPQNVAEKEKLLLESGVIVTKSNYQSSRLASALMNALERRNRA